jgi:hypothetical protein
MKKIRPLKILARADKWYLGGGGRLLWAPPFPLYLDRPGFWDPAHYFNFEVQPLFTWTILDEQDREIMWKDGSRTWSPASLTTKRTARGEAGLVMTEERFVLPIDVAGSTLRLSHTSPRRRTLHLIAWTSQPSSPSRAGRAERAAFVNRRLEFTRHMHLGDGPEHPVATVMGLSRNPDSYEIRLSEGTIPGPFWKQTPFCESFRSHRLQSTSHTTGLADDGVLFLALHATITLPPNGTAGMTAACALGPSLPGAHRALSIALRQDNPPELSAAAWAEYFSDVPFFSCSDEFLTQYYWYRWYGLRLNTIAVQEGNYQYPFVCEGIAYFRAPISYSAFCHMLENRWRHTPDLAQGSLLTFLANQRDDGGFRGYIDVNHYRQEMFYHADWGRAVRALHRIHPEASFLTSAYEGLVRYVEYFDRERDPEQSGMYHIHNHYETGQEYMHRYTAVNPDADRDNWGEVFRLKGVDATVYVYQLKQTLGWIAGQLGRDSDVLRWNHEAGRTRRAVLDRMWDSEEELFFDIDPASGTRTRVKAATCFYPFLTDMVTPAHLPGLTRHLLNPDEFWTPFPAPSTSADDETFSAEPVWKGKRMNCPWNGRVWPMTNSHLAEALGSAAAAFNDRNLKKKTAEFITRFIRMMFFDRDPRRPNSFEHYNPLTGQPSSYRGIDDYQHSWINDLILRYVAGIFPGDGCVTIDPFPFGLDWFTCDHVIVSGHHIRVEGRKHSYTVTVDGKRTETARTGKSLTIQF